MKKQRLELTHDIIAETIWARLPEQDKQLREIRRSIAQRLEDYEKGKGSLLGKAELDGWGLYLPMLELTGEEAAFLEESRQVLEAAGKAEAERLEKEKRQLKRTRRLQFGIAILLILASMISGYFIWDASKKTENAKEAEMKAYLAEEKADSALNHAEKEADKAYNAIELAEFRGEMIKTAEKKARKAISQGLVAQSDLLFNDLETAKSFRLLQEGFVA